MDHKIQEMEMYAKMHKVPIMESEGISFLLDYIKKNNINHILEIGTAIGYSAIRMCLLSSTIKVTTIERDKERYEQALIYIEDFGLQDRIHVIFQDALMVELEDTFDMIFIDAAKGQYLKFFEKFEKNLVSHGVVISDNLNFHGLIDEDESALSRNVRGMVQKLKQYREFLESNKYYKTTIYNIGDGVGISVSVN